MQGFGVTAKSTEESRNADPAAITIFHQADLGEVRTHMDVCRCVCLCVCMSVCVIVLIPTSTCARRRPLHSPVCCLFVFAWCVWWWQRPAVIKCV